MATSDPSKIYYIIGLLEKGKRFLQYVPRSKLQ